MKSNPTEILSLDGEEASLNKVDTALQSVGIQLKDTSGQFRNLDEVIFELADAWDGLDRNTQRWIANTVAGSRQQSRFLALMSDSARLHELYNAAIDSEDASLIQYAKTLDSMDSKINQLSTSFQQFYMQIANGETLKTGLDWLIQFVDRMNEVGPLGAATIVASMLQAATQIGRTFALLISTIYQKAVDSSNKKKIISNKNTDEIIQHQKEAIDYISNYEVQKAKQTQQQVQDIKTGQQVPQNGQTTTQGTPTSIRKASKSTIAVQTISSVLSIASAAFFTFADQSDEFSANSAKVVASINGIAGAVSAVVGAYTGNIGMIISGITQLGSAINQFVSLTETTEERLQRLNKAIEKSNIQRATAKKELDDLKSLEKKYNELSMAQYDSAEAYQEWVDLNAQIIEAYPELISYIDSEGNSIANLNEQYQDLVAIKQKAYDASLNQYELDILTKAQDPYSVLYNKGLLVKQDNGIFNSTYRDSQQMQLDLFNASGNREELLENLANQILELDGLLGAMISPEGQSLAEVVPTTDIVVQILENLASGALSFEEALNDYGGIASNIVDTLESLGYSQDSFRGFVNWIDILKSQTDQGIQQIVQQRINSITSTEDDKILSSVLNKGLSEYWEQVLAEGLDGSGRTLADIYQKDFLGGLSDEITDIKDLYSGFNREDIAKLTTERNTLTIEEYERIKDINSGLIIWLDDSELILNELESIRDLNLDKIRDLKTIGISNILDRLNSANQSLFVDTVTSIQKLIDVDQIVKESLIEKYDIVTNALVSSGLTQPEIYDLLSGADFTSRSGILSFSEELLKIEGLNKSIVNELIDYAKTMQMTAADIDTTLTNANKALIEVQKYNLDSAFSLKDINELVATGKFSYSDFDKEGKFIGTLEEFYKQYLGSYIEEVNNVLSSENSTQQAKDQAQYLQNFINQQFESSNKTAEETIVSNLTSLFAALLEGLSDNVVTITEEQYKLLNEKYPDLAKSFTQGIKKGEYQYSGKKEDLFNILDTIIVGLEDTAYGWFKSAYLQNADTYKAGARATDISLAEKIFSSITEDGVITISTEIYDVISKYLGDSIGNLNELTGTYDYNGTVEQYLDAVYQALLAILGEGSWTTSFEQTKKEIQNNAEAIRLEKLQTSLESLASSNKSGEYKSLLETLRDTGVSADEAITLIEELGYTINDFYATGDGKLKLIGNKDLENIQTTTELQKEINSLEEQINNSSDKEKKKLEAILAIRKEELKALKEKGLLVGKTNDADRFSDPKTFLSNISDLNTAFEDMRENMRIEYETIYNLLDNEEWAGALSQSLGLIEGAQKEGISSAEYFAKHYTDTYADIDTGKVYLKLSDDMVQAIETGSNDQLKAFAKSRIDALDAQITMLETLKTVSEMGDIDAGNVKGFINFEWETSDGNPLNTPTDVLNYLTNTISDPQIWEALTKNVKEKYPEVPIAIGILTYLSEESKDAQEWLDKLGLKRKAKVELEAEEVDTKPLEDETKKAAEQATSTPIDAEQQVNVETVVSTSQATNKNTAPSPEIYRDINKQKEEYKRLNDIESSTTVVIDSKLETDTSSAKKDIQDLKDEVEKESAKLKVEADTADAKKDFNQLITYFKSIIVGIPLSIIDKATSMVDTIIKQIQSKSATIPVYTKYINSNNNSSNQSNSYKPSVPGKGTNPFPNSQQVYANGGIVGKTNKALVGELGPELRVSNGKYSIVGANGAEFINLKKNDIIFNAKQTQGLLNGKSGIRGTAMAYGNAFASGSGIDAAIAALRSERSMWASILKKLPDMLNKAGGGSSGGGGGGGSNKEYLMELERWFNWLRQIEQLENKITILRAQRENMKDGKVYADSLYKENALLKKQYDITKDLVNNQIAYRNSLKEDYLKNYGRYFYFIGDALQINAQAIMDDTKNNEELGESIQNMIDEYDDINSQITDNTTALEENKKQIEDNVSILHDKYIEVENQVLETLKSFYEKQIELKQKELDSKVEADNEYISALKKSLEKEKEMREKANIAEDKAQLQRKLALLERDTSGRNVKEIASLREQLRQMQEDEYYSGREEAISSIEEATKNQQDALQKQIDIMEEANQIKLDNMTLYWAEVESIMSQGADNILGFLQSYSDEYNNVSKIQQEDYLTTWKFTIDAALTYAQDMQKQFDEVIYKAQEAAKYGNTSATGGLTSNNNSSISSSGGGSSGSSSKSSTSKKTSSSSSKTNKNDGVAHGWYYHISKSGETISKVGPYSTRKEAQSRGSATQKKMGAGYKYYTKYYLNGGLADYTGYAWVDGTKTKPESFLDAEDTQLLAKFMEYAKKSSFIPTLDKVNMRSPSIENDNSVTIHNVDIKIESGVVKNKEDAERLGSTVANQLMKIARQSGNISVSRR